MTTNKHLWSHLAQFILEWEMLHTRVVEKIKTHILCAIPIFENRAVYEIMWKYIVQPDGPQKTTWRAHTHTHHMISGTKETNTAILNRYITEVSTRIIQMCQSQWQRGLRRGSAAARLLEFWIRIPPGARTSFSCDCCLLSCRGPCLGLITRPQEFYRLYCAWVWSWNLDNGEAMAHWGRKTYYSYVAHSLHPTFTVLTPHLTSHTFIIAHLIIRHSTVYSQTTHTTSYFFFSVEYPSYRQRSLNS
jgi:hypothetical protein